MKDKSLSCPFCEKGFAIAENLEAHIEFHEQLDERRKNTGYRSYRGSQLYLFFLCVCKRICM